MSDRTINWGDSEVEAAYQTGDDDPDGGGNFIVARDTDGGVTLLEYDPVAGEWVARSDVTLDGNDLANVGTLSATDVNADSVNTGTVSGAVVNRPEAITNLEGDLYLASEGTDPGTVLENDGDMVFIHE